MECSNHFPSFGLLECVLGPFGGKQKVVLGHKMRKFGRAPLDLAPLPRGATAEFLAQTWIWQGHDLGCEMARLE